ncbi:MAG: ATP-binding protein [Actinomycetota bacterium]|nr:ATP-binding protein [Actinomycetota bacterium]
MPEIEDAQASDRNVALTIPARPEHLVLARLALSAVCRLTPLGAEDVADFKLAVTEAANDFFNQAEPAAGEGRLNFSFVLEDGRLAVRLDGPPSAQPTGEQELGRAIIDATVDEAHYQRGHTELVKYLPDSPDSAGAQPERWSGEHRRSAGY